MILSGEVVLLKFTLTKSILTSDGSTSHSKAARIVLSRPPENITNTEGYYSIESKGML